MCPFGIWKCKVIPVICMDVRILFTQHLPSPLNAHCNISGKSYLLFLNWCYLIPALPASITLVCFFPFQLSTTPDITQKAEDNLPIYFLYLHVLMKCLLILCRSIRTLNVNVLLLYFGNQNQLGTALLKICVSKSLSYVSFRSILWSTTLANAYIKGWGQMTSDIFPGYSFQYLTYIKTTRICYSLIPNLSWYNTFFQMLTRITLKFKKNTQNYS